MKRRSQRLGCPDVVAPESNENAGAKKRPKSTATASTIANEDVRTTPSLQMPSFSLINRDTTSDPAAQPPLNTTVSPIENQPRRLFVVYQMVRPPATDGPTEPSETQPLESQPHSTNRETVIAIKTEIKEEPTDLNMIKTEIKAEPSDEQDGPSASTSTGVQTAAAASRTVKSEYVQTDNLPEIPNVVFLRPTCQFGIRCYIHRSTHRNEMAHPGDPDYRRPNLQSMAGAPNCPFGARCYRRNPTHFLQLYHPAPDNYDPSALPPNPQRRFVVVRTHIFPPVAYVTESDNDDNDFSSGDSSDIFDPESSYESD